MDILSQNNKQKLLEEFIQDQDCFVAGSSWPEDLNLISKVIESSEKLKTIIAPHNVDEKSLQEIESHFSKPIIRWSELSKKTDAESTILLIDCVGILTKVYSYANVAYVGGGMGNKGLHNTLEPAVFGIPVMIGKNYKNYQEAMDLVALGGIISVDSSFNFYKEFSRVMKDKKLQKQMGITNLKYIKSKAGTTFKIMNKLKQVLNS